MIEEPRRTQGAPDPDRLEALVDAVVPAVDPERVHLFGSAAAGTMTEDSDIDILVVLAGTTIPDEAQDAATTLNAELPGAHVTLTTVQEFEARGTKWYELEHAAGGRGNLLYERPSAAPWIPPDPCEPSPEERLQDAETRRYDAWRGLQRSIRGQTAGRAERYRDAYTAACEFVQAVLMAAGIRGWIKLPLAALVRRAAGAGIEGADEAAAAARMPEPPERPSRRPNPPEPSEAEVLEMVFHTEETGRWARTALQRRRNVSQTRIGKGNYSGLVRFDDLPARAAKEGEAAWRAMAAGNPDRAAAAAARPARIGWDYLEGDERQKMPGDSDIHLAQEPGGAKCGRRTTSEGEPVSWTPESRLTDCWACNEATGN